MALEELKGLGNIFCFIWKPSLNLPKLLGCLRKSQFWQDKNLMHLTKKSWLGYFNMISKFELCLVQLIAMDGPYKLLKTRMLIRLESI